MDVHQDFSGRIVVKNKDSVLIIHSIKEAGELITKLSNIIFSEHEDSKND